MWQLNMKVTKEDIFKFSPCSVATEQMVDACFAGREYLTIQDILNLAIVDEYKLWLLLRPELIPYDKLSNIRVEFIGLMDKQWLIDLCGTCPVYETIGRVARCFDRPYNETYGVLMQIVEKYIA